MSSTRHPHHIETSSTPYHPHHIKRYMVWVTVWTTTIWCGLMVWMTMVNVIHTIWYGVDDTLWCGWLRIWCGWHMVWVTYCGWHMVWSIWCGWHMVWVVWCGEQTIKRGTLYSCTWSHSVPTTFCAGAVLVDVCTLNTWTKQTLDGGCVKPEWY